MLPVQVCCWLEDLHLVLTECDQTESDSYYSSGVMLSVQLVHT